MNWKHISDPTCKIFKKWHTIYITKTIAPRAWLMAPTLTDEVHKFVCLFWLIGGALLWNPMLVAREAKTAALKIDIFQIHRIDNQTTRTKSCKRKRPSWHGCRKCCCKCKNSSKCRAKRPLPRTMSRRRSTASSPPPPQTQKHQPLAWDEMATVDFALFAPVFIKKVHTPKQTRLWPPIWLN